MFKVIFTFMLVFISQCVFSQQAREIKPTNGLCSKASSISKGLAEYVASKKQISISSVKLIRSFDYQFGCSIYLDTPKGPINCDNAQLYTDGKDYWVGGGFCT